MSDTIRVRVARGEFRYDREHYTQGDELEVHERALEKHPRTLTRVEEARDESVAPDPREEMVAEEFGEDPDADLEERLAVEDLDPHPSDLTVPEMEDRLASVDDVAHVEAILDAERESDDPRTTAIDVIESRLAELEG
jgi:hypothetical protein